MDNGKEVKPATSYVDGNPKAAEGAKKVPLHLVPTTAIEAMALAFKDGANKYGAYNWREPGKAVSISTYIAAARRHIDAIWEGQDIDPTSGAPHAGHAAACMAIVEDARRLGCLIDDRPKLGVHRPAAPKDAIEGEPVGKIRLGKIRLVTQRGTPQVQVQYLHSIAYRDGEFDGARWGSEFEAPQFDEATYRKLPKPHTGVLEFVVDDLDQLSKRIMSPGEWKELYRAPDQTQTEAQPSEERGYIRIKPGHPTLAASGGRYLVSLVDHVGTWGTRKQARLHSKETFDKFPTHEGKQVIEFLPQGYFAQEQRRPRAVPVHQVGLNELGTSTLRDWWRTLRQEGCLPGLPRAVKIGHSAAQELKRSIEGEFFPRKSQTGKTRDLTDTIGWWTSLDAAKRRQMAEEASRQVLPWPRFYFVRAQA